MELDYLFTVKACLLTQARSFTALDESFYDSVFPAPVGA